MDEQPTTKRGALIAAILLVVVLAGGFVAYRTLRAGHAPADSSSAATNNNVNADKTDEAAGVPMLADYDATVYTDLDEPVSLSMIADGKPLVINFWATWCPYCVREMPDYQEIYNEFGDRVAFAFVDVPGSRGETAEKALAWLKDNGYEDLPVYFDNDMEASAMYGARSLPTTVIVSADGEIQDISPGAIDPTLMRAALNSLAK